MANFALRSPAHGVARHVDSTDLGDAIIEDDWSNPGNIMPGPIEVPSPTAGVDNAATFVTESVALLDLSPALVPQMPLSSHQQRAKQLSMHLTTESQTRSPRRSETSSQALPWTATPRQSPTPVCSPSHSPTRHSSAHWSERPDWMISASTSGAHGCRSAAHRPRAEPVFHSTERDHLYNNVVMLVGPHPYRPLSVVPQLPRTRSPGIRTGEESFGVPITSPSSASLANSPMKSPSGMHLTKHSSIQPYIRWADSARRRAQCEHEDAERDLRICSISVKEDAAFRKQLQHEKEEAIAEEMRRQALDAERLKWQQEEAEAIARARAEEEASLAAAAAAEQTAAAAAQAAEQEAIGQRDGMTAEEATEAEHQAEHSNVDTLNDLKQQVGKAEMDSNEPVVEAAHVIKPAWDLFLTLDFEGLSLKERRSKFQKAMMEHGVDFGGDDVMHDRFEARAARKEARRISVKHGHRGQL